MWLQLALPDQAAVSELSVKVEGLATFDSTMKKAADELGRLTDAQGKAAAVIEQAARARAPRRSGRLAGSIRASRGAGGEVLQVTAAYAGPIHWGWPSRHIDPQPFAMDAARATEGQWIKFYETDVQKTLDGVKGA